MIHPPNAALLKVTTFWFCPNCKFEDVTSEVRPHTRFHNCVALAGISAPMFPKGTKVKVTAVEREDYIGPDQLVRRDANGRPIMSVITEREDGTDVMVFAPTALARLT